VSWLVETTPVSASKAQVAAFTKAMGHPNNRPVQPINSRQVILQ
jgi:carbonic anhydrase